MWGSRPISSGNADEMKEVDRLDLILRLMHVLVRLARDVYELIEIVREYMKGR